MDLIGTLNSDTALLLFSAAGLVATTVAILFDTNAQKQGRAEVRIER